LSFRAVTPAKAEVTANIARAGWCARSKAASASGSSAHERIAEPKIAAFRGWIFEEIDG
jgi:hypothetical protein